MKIAIGNDHLAYCFKLELLHYLQELKHAVTDFGTDSFEPCDYPYFAEQVSRAVSQGSYERGILICGSGVGMCIAANKITGARAVVGSDPYTAKYSRAHNDANVLCFGARTLGVEYARMILDMWLGQAFEEGRHIHRIEMITDIERRERR
jgi:ribose 5-phosphate isomerase B